MQAQQSAAVLRELRTRERVARECAAESVRAPLNKCLTLATLLTVSR